MKSLKGNIAVSILVFINFIFLYKYVSRYTEFGIYISLLILVAQVGVYRFRNSITISIKSKQIICFAVLIGIISLVLISHFAIPVESLNVDRATVISSFLTELFQGDYPYFARSHMGNFPGPMPVYFLIAAPFYLLGELSILSALGYLVFVLLIRKKINSAQNLNFIFFYFLTSAYLIWEIATRSNVFSFTTLLLFVLMAFLNLERSQTTRFYILAILTGILLSTRSVYILAYFIFFISSLTNREITFKRLFLFLSIAVLAFGASFLPFIIFFKDEFAMMNPFIIQSSFLVPTFYTAIFMLISIVLAFFVKNKIDKLFYSGLSLFIAIFIYSVYHIVNFGYEKSYMNSNVDISYFIFCMPFLIMYLLNEETLNTPKIELLKT
ncbi:hypothetical protein G3O08_00700 [Cryomorpha ignava]|uniref:Glycosyltransferase RgtA/B/C/D-like domain-containing protein n=1 Tax=Cryomorpha ignava TaxID=101383 RepID=A0A7K3WMA8_9FLAO|nr:hypothetical protein [Cryomorpha ignava]NEN22022.1 hypothetical protein [Cryomorpha ignava]